MELKKTTLTCEQAFWHDFLKQQKEKQLNDQKTTNNPHPKPSTKQEGTK